jgi:hypothetical protein
MRVLSLGLALLLCQFASAGTVTYTNGQMKAELNAYGGDPIEWSVWDQTEAPFYVAGSGYALAVIDYTISVTTSYPGGGDGGASWCIDDCAPEFYIGGGWNSGQLIVPIELGETHQLVGVASAYPRPFCLGGYDRSCQAGWYAQTTSTLIINIYTDVAGQPGNRLIILPGPSAGDDPGSGDPGSQTPEPGTLSIVAVALGLIGPVRRWNRRRTIAHDRQISETT